MKILLACCYLLVIESFYLVKTEKKDENNIFENVNSDPLHSSELINKNKSDQNFNKKKQFLNSPKPLKTQSMIIPGVNKKAFALPKANSFTYDKLVSQDYFDNEQSILEQNELGKRMKKLSQKYIQQSFRIISFLLYNFQIIMAFYLLIFGFKIQKITLTMLGFFGAYYLTLYIMTLTLWFDSSKVFHQLLLFFVCIILTFGFSILGYIGQIYDTVVLGLSLGSISSLQIAIFFTDFEQIQERFLLKVIFIGLSILFFGLAYKFEQIVLTVGTALIGAIILPIYIGILMSDLDSFENRINKKYIVDFQKFRNYLIISLVLFFIGLSLQLLLKKWISKDFGKNEIDEIRKSSI